MEDAQEREKRLKEAEDKALDMKIGPNHLIPVQTPEFDGGIIIGEPTGVFSPVEDSCLDALVYLREGLSRQEVVEAILIRNRVGKDDAEKIVDQALSQMEPIDKSRKEKDDPNDSNGSDDSSSYY